MFKRIEKGICGICGAGCGVSISLENDRITKILPWKKHPQGQPCLRGVKASSIVYARDRITKPLKRIGPKGTLAFTEISWDQALDEISQKILNLKSQYGPQCIASFFGRGNFEDSIWKMFSPKEKGLAIPNSLFMPMGSPNAFSIGNICHVSHAFIAPFTIFGAPGGMLQPDLEHADIIFIWGTNPATGSPLKQFLQLKKAKARGAKTVVIDPLKTQTAEMADLWIPIQPGTDGALIHGILCQCFKRGGVDRAFGEEQCQGFSDLEQYVKGFNPDLVHQITGVSEESLKELTELILSTEKIAYMTQSGLEFNDTGAQSIRALLSLWALTGHLDVKGGMVFKSRSPVSLSKPDVKYPTDIPPIGMDRYPLFCNLTKNGHFSEFPRSVLQEDPYKIRFLLIGGSSILTSWPNSALYAKALNALDYQVCVDLFLKQDARYADMVLPATTYFENTSLCGYPGQAALPTALQYRKKIIEPMGESMNSYLIYAKLAERLGYGHLYPHTEEDMVRFLIKDLPMNFQTFKHESEKGPVTVHKVAPNEGQEKKWLSGQLRPDGNPGFNTPSGKWEISSTLLEKYGYEPLPVYTPASEGPLNKALSQDFPLTLTSGARIMQSTFRSQHQNIPNLVRLQPNAEAILHPRDAAPRNISSGDAIWVKTARGKVKFIARVTQKISKGVVEVNQGGGAPNQADGWKNSNINLLTDDRNRDSITGFPVFKALLCELEKVGSAAKQYKTGPIGNE
ncbi:Anaerobic selenocysteine-containing dehydrogenase [Desulfocicer vacuolatum DSM 3385]|uniref:Anaerobic selenocysteine-containing dehydrogenase n=1 Tax=Desulfocicer vacuolatum DSM 3385 TaxID=1121400 RepID=A0A1W2EUI0_9BACT|nr:molybdopterin-dependent oxidoreductase [Desulfocicer vacuolatum]SMD13367.1 Anaerobic selenocysteine-containing dehydrogenase [Desulfocicer vacuolatum DSM 3385]